MSVFRVEKTRDYTVMSNIHLKDRTLSFKAKGLLSMMLSLPDDWDYTIAGLIAISKENETAVKNTMKELKEHGYLEVTKERTEKGTFEYIYNIYEKPKPDGKKPEVENLGVDNLQVENQGQLNTNNKILNNPSLSTSINPLDNLKNIDSNIQPISYLNPKGYRKPKGNYLLSQDSLNFKEGEQGQDQEKPPRLFYPADAELNEAFCDYLDMREAIGKKVTSRKAMFEVQSTLKNLSGGDRDRAIRILLKSVENSWCSLRPLEDDKPPQKTQIQKLLEL